MAFDVNTITYTGARLLVQATVSDRLVISGCGVTDTILSTTDAQYVEDFAGPMYTDNAEISGTTTNHVIFRATFPASSVYGGDHHSLILYGHLESESASVKHAIAVISAIEPFHLPTPTDVVSMFEALFTLQYAVTDGVITTQTTALETSKAEFDVLEARVVTCHSKNGPTDGERQEIYGVKLFESNVWFSEHVHIDGGFQSNDDMLIYGHILVGEGNKYDIGSADSTFKEIFVETVSTGSITTSDISVIESILPNSIIASVGGPDDYFPNGYISELYADEIHCPLVIGDLNGLIPYPKRSSDALSGSEINVPVGGIVGIYTAGLNSQDTTGLQFTVSAKQIKTCMFNSSGVPVAGLFYIPAGTYRGIGGGSATMNGGGFAMLIRVS